jgi:hypothetical protein
MDENPSSGREALIVWLKLIGLLALVAAFGALIFWLRRAIAR